MLTACLTESSSHAMKSRYLQTISLLMFLTAFPWQSYFGFAGTIPGMGFNNTLTLGMYNLISFIYYFNLPNKCNF